MKFADIKGLSPNELRIKKRETKAAMFEARMKNAMGQLASPIAIRGMRRDIARLNMVLGMNSKSSGASQ